MVSLVSAPTEVLRLVEEYICHPGDHFALKSSCKITNSIMSPDFYFESTEHLVGFCVKYLFPLGRQMFSHIALDTEITLSVAMELLTESIPSGILVALLTDDEIEALCERGDRVLVHELFKRCICSTLVNLACHILWRRLALFSHTEVYDLATRKDLARRIVKYGEDEDVQYLFSRAQKMFPKCCMELTIIVAIRRGLAETVRYMMSRGVDLSRTRDGEYPVYAAVDSGNMVILQMMIDKGVSLLTRYRSRKSHVLHTACLSGNVRAVDLLLKAGVDVEERNFYGETPQMVLKQMLREEKEKRKGRKSAGPNNLAANARAIQQLLSRYTR